MSSAPDERRAVTRSVEQVSRSLATAMSDSCLTPFRRRWPATGWTLSANQKSRSEKWVNRSGNWPTLRPHAFVCVAKVCRHCWQACENRN